MNNQKNLSGWGFLQAPHQISPLRVWESHVWLGQLVHKDAMVWLSWDGILATQGRCNFGLLVICFLHRPSLLRSFLPAWHGLPEAAGIQSLERKRRVIEQESLFIYCASIYVKYYNKVFSVAILVIVWDWGAHYLHKLFVLHLSIGVNVRFAENLVNWILNKI